MRPRSFKKGCLLQLSYRQTRYESRESHFWSPVTCVLSFTAMTKAFRKPRIRKFGDVSRLTRLKPLGGGTQPQGNEYESI